MPPSTVMHPFAHSSQSDLSLKYNPTVIWESFFVFNVVPLFSKFRSPWSHKIDIFKILRDEMFLSVHFRILEFPIACYLCPGIPSIDRWLGCKQWLPRDCGLLVIILLFETLPSPFSLCIRYHFIVFFCHFFLVSSTSSHSRVAMDLVKIAIIWVSCCLTIL